MITEAMLGISTGLASVCLNTRPDIVSENCESSKHMEARTAGTHVKCLKKIGGQRN